jgi:hypothetical protein
MNRKIDTDILAELQNATQTCGAAVTASLNLVVKAKTILGNNSVDVDEEDNMFGVISYAFDAYLMQIPEYTKASYVEIKPFNMPAKRFRAGPASTGSSTRTSSGKGTSLEYCFLYHRNAIGHAVNTGDIQALAGYHEEQDYSWARTTGFFGSKLLQNSGVVVMKHDGSAYVASYDGNRLSLLVSSIEGQGPQIWSLIGDAISGRRRLRRVHRRRSRQRITVDRPIGGATANEGRAAHARPFPFSPTLR